LLGGRAGGQGQRKDQNAHLKYSAAKRRRV